MARLNDEGSNMSATGVLERKMYQDGDRIFKEGDEGLFAYLVQSGSVEIYREQTGQVITTIGAGGIFGEMALIDGKPRAASARSAGLSTSREFKTWTGSIMTLWYWSDFGDSYRIRPSATAWSLE